MSFDQNAAYRNRNLSYNFSSASTDNILSSIMLSKL